MLTPSSQATFCQSRCIMKCPLLGWTPAICPCSDRKIAPEGQILPLWLQIPAPEGQIFVPPRANICPSGTIFRSMCKSIPGRVMSIRKEGLSWGEKVGQRPPEVSLCYPLVTQRGSKEDKGSVGTLTSPGQMQGCLRKCYSPAESGTPAPPGRKMSSTVP